MALGDIVFIKGQGGLGRPLAGQDFVSGLLFYTNNPPSAWDTTPPVQTLFSVADAENNGISADYTDNTFATATFVINTAGNPGDTINISVTGINGVIYNLGTYTVPASTSSQIGDIAAVINSNTLATGFSASVSGSTLTIKAPTNQGIALNRGVSVTFSSDATLTGSFTPVPFSTDGVTAIFVISAAGANDDTVDIAITGVNGVTYNLGKYTSTGNDLDAEGIANMINNGPYSNIYTATYVTGTSLTTGEGTGTVTIKASVNQNPIVLTFNASTHFSIGLKQFGVSPGVAGTASEQAVWHYHISEYFRLQPKGQLYVGFFPVPESWSTYTYGDVTTTQNYANGSIRQLAVYKGSAAFSSNDLTAIHTEIVTNNDANHQPLSALYGANLIDAETNATITDLSTLTNLNTLAANKASAVISQDGGALGAYLYAHAGYSITTLGAALGAVSFAAVSDSIEWIAKFNISNGIECDTPALANGQLIGAQSQNYLNAIDNLGYIFLVSYVGIAGSYFNHDYTAITNSSDYSRIRNNRTIDKACRGVYASILPALGSPLVLNSDGTLSNETIAYFIGLAEVNLVQMVRDTELSDYAVTIDPTQNVQSTGKLIIAVQLLEIGTAESIQVNIGFTTSITQ